MRIEIEKFYGQLYDRPMNASMNTAWSSTDDARLA
jgi:hypothetical protein